MAAFDQTLYQIDHTGAVRAAVYKVTHKHQATRLGVAACFVIAKVVQQCLQGLQFTVDVAHDV